MPTRIDQTTARGKLAAELDAIELLEQDHTEIKTLLKRFGELVEGGAAAGERQLVALQICAMLRVHTQIEEEIFYPEAREIVIDENLMRQALIEHAGVKDLIAQIETLSPDDAMFDIRMKVLGAFIDHHVREEQETLFPRVSRRMDIEDVGVRLQARKVELMLGPLSH